LLDSLLQEIIFFYRMGNCFGAEEEQPGPDPDERRRMQAAAAERRQKEQEGRGLKEGGGRLQKKAADQEKYEKLAQERGGEPGMKWQVG